MLGDRDDAGNGSWSAFPVHSLAMQMHSSTHFRPRAFRPTSGVKTRDDAPDKQAAAEQPWRRLDRVGGLDTTGGIPMDPGLIISIIAILIVATVAWKEFGGKHDLKRLRDRLRRDEPGD
jgi:hypothetical protein